MKLAADDIKKIAVFRALQLGDMLCAVPAFRALRQAYPTAEISLIGLPWAASFVERFHSYLDAFIVFAGYPGLPEQTFDPRAFTHFLNEVQQHQFDLILQMQGNGSLVNPLVQLFGARYTAGYFVADHYYPPNGLFIPYPGYGSEIKRHLALMQSLGIPATDVDLEFAITAKDEEEYIKADLKIQPSNYVCVHPGSRGTWRQWPTAYFAKVADYCAEQGLQVVITGTKEELELANTVAAQMKYEPTIVAGRTSLGTLAVLIRDAHLLVSNCTGVSHIAAALKTPSVVISMDNEPERWGPINTLLHTTIDWISTPDFNEVFEAVRLKIA